jgi:hypothetical protein
MLYPQVSSNVYHDSFCQLDSSVSLPWVIYFEAFYLHAKIKKNSGAKRLNTVYLRVNLEGRIDGLSNIKLHKTDVEFLFIFLVSISGF